MNKLHLFLVTSHFIFQPANWKKSLSFPLKGTQSIFFKTDFSVLLEESSLRRKFKIFDQKSWISESLEKSWNNQTRLLLTAHNWQKWKSRFLTCPCHKIYRVEAAGLILLKLRFLLSMWVFFCTYVMHIIVINHCTPHFVSTKSIFGYIQIFLTNFAYFTIKSPSITQRSVSQENAFKKSKNPLAFCCKTIGSNNSFILIENNFRFLR